MQKIIGVISETEVIQENINEIQTKVNEKAGMPQAQITEEEICQSICESQERNQSSETNALYNQK
jgi:hypothetical protein